MSLYDTFDIAFVGTSLTTGQYGNWQENLKTRLQKEVTRPLRFYDFGAAGATSASLLAGVGAPRRMRPRCVVLECGMNDANLAVPLATFSANLASLVWAFRSSDPSTAIFLMTMNPAIAPASPSLIAALPGYYQAIRDLSHGEETGLIDNTPLWGAPTPAQIPDGVHPTPASARQIMVPNIIAALEPLAS